MARTTASQAPPVIASTGCQTCPTAPLVAATSGTADEIAHPEVGLIAPGRHADFVLVDGDPLAGIAIVQEPARIVTVIGGGQTIIERR